VRDCVASRWPLWEMLDELDFDILEKSPHLDSNRRRRLFYPMFARSVIGAFIATGRQDPTTRVHRTE